MPSEAQASGPQGKRPERALLAAQSLVGWGVYALPVVALLGFLGDLPRVAVVVTALVAAVVGAIAWAALARRFGPRNLLRLALLGWFVGVVLLAFQGVLGLPEEIGFVYGAWMGLAFSGVATGDARSVWAAEAVRARWQQVVLASVSGFALGVALWFLFLALPVGRTFGYILHGLVALAAWRVLRPVEDPVHPDDPLQRYAPWGDGSGLPRREGWIRLFAAPAATVYLVVSWALFLPFAEVRRGILQLPFEMTERFAYNIPDLTNDPLSALQSLVTAPFVNHDVVQLVYISALVVFFGIPFEAREGTKRFLLVFFGVGTAAALVAGILLHLVYPGISTDPVFEEAWRRTWSGGSAAAFGVMGAIAARAPIPWPLLGFFVFWELNVGWWFLRSYTPAFHVSALFLGFLLVRLGVTPHREDAPTSAS